MALARQGFWRAAFLGSRNGTVMRTFGRVVFTPQVGPDSTKNDDQVGSRALGFRMHLGRRGNNLVFPGCDELLRHNTERIGPWLIKTSHQICTGVGVNDFAADVKSGTDNRHALIVFNEAADNEAWKSAYRRGGRSS